MCLGRSANFEQIEADSENPYKENEKKLLIGGNCTNIEKKFSVRKKRENCVNCVSENGCKGAKLNREPK